MTILRRHHLSLIVILALFAANLFAYFWSARMRRLAQTEWEAANSAEIKISKIQQDLDYLNKQAQMASQIQDEPAVIGADAPKFEQKAKNAQSAIEELRAEASPDQTAAIDEFYESYLELSQDWLAFYHNTGTNGLAAVRGLVQGDSLWPKVFGQQLPNLQKLEAARATRAQEQFRRASMLSNLVIIVTFLLSGLIAWTLSSLFSRHLKFGFTTLQRGTRLIGNMELEHRVEYPMNDEFGELAQSFNEMAGKLSSSQKELLQTNKQLGESEERYRNLVNRAVYGIYSCTEDGRFLDANPALIKMLGYSSKQDLYDLDMISEVYSDPGDHGQLLEKLRESSSIEGLEIYWRKKNGESIIARLSGNAVIVDGKIIECEMIAENVTERRVLEDQLRQAQKMEAIGRLAGGIAHDFNNLLTVIKGHCELIQGELEPGSSIEKEIDGVIRASDRAVSLTRQLLAFSRRQLLTPKIVDMNSIIVNMEKLLGRLLGENILLTTSLDSRIGTIKADPSQIEQVLMNLAVNARDAMPTGGDLRISTSKLELRHELRLGDIRLRPGKYVTLSVKDNGQGMDSVTRSRIFEPFFTTKEPGKGTGLGLSTVYGIVKQSEGEIWVESAPGQGALFRICFPQAAAAEKEAEGTGAASANEGKETILIVEDEDDVRTVASLMLKRRGYNVLSTGHADEAQELCMTHPEPIHLLLTDVVLKEKGGGMELAQVLLKVRPEMKVIYMSGYTEDVMLQHGVKNSQVAFLPKPFTTEELTSKVREVLDRVISPTLVRKRSFGATS